MKEIPTPEEFLLNVSLYTPYSIYASSKHSVKSVLEIEFFSGPLDAYCPECDSDSVFHREISLPAVGEIPNLRNAESVEDLLSYHRAFFRIEGETSAFPRTPEDYVIQTRNILLKFECTRDPSHLLLFLLRVQNEKIMKVGQYPSLADLQAKETKKYRGVLEDDKLREFNRAIGLNAHGVGIGAFVYLRRIFEGLIEDARAEAAQNPDWDNEKFLKSRMDEKVLMLRAFLPTFLVENRAIYSILSAGIHSLTEEECQRYFKPLRVSIELILGERIKQREQDKKISGAKKDIDSIRRELGSE